jgi:hypothetical protein
LAQLSQSLHNWINTKDAFSVTHLELLSLLILYKKYVPSEQEKVCQRVKKENGKNMVLGFSNYFSCKGSSVVLHKQDKSILK